MLCDSKAYVRTGNRDRMALETPSPADYNRVNGRFVAAPERVGMFSPTEINHVAWFLVLLIGGWILVNALVDVSEERSERRREQAANDLRDGTGD